MVNLKGKKSAGNLRYRCVRCVRNFVGGPYFYRLTLLDKSFVVLWKFCGRMTFHGKCSRSPLLMVSQLCFREANSPHQKTLIISVTCNKLDNVVCYSGSANNLSAFYIKDTKGHALTSETIQRPVVSTKSMILPKDLLARGEEWKLQCPLFGVSMY